MKCSHLAHTPQTVTLLLTLNRDVRREILNLTAEAKVRLTARLTIFLSYEHKENTSNESVN